ncbi:MAG: pyridoxal phosphate-dependent transferase, partial [Olpidium bornovanus]
MPTQAVTAANLLQAVVDVLNTTLEVTAAACEQVPGSAIFWRYVQRSYQNDPFRVGLELLLLCFGIAYLFHRKTHPDEGTMVKLSDKEIEELVDEWQPDPLVPALTEADRLELETLPVVAGSPGAKLRIKDGRVAVNLASYNFLGLVANETIKVLVWTEAQALRAKAVATLRKYGVGSCGPPGFYGTLDVHRDLEKQIAEFLGTEEAIIYSQSFSTVSSVIPAFAKRGDIIVCDDGVNFAVQKGIQISRSVIR